MKDRLPGTVLGILMVTAQGIVHAAQPIGCIIEPEYISDVGSPVAGIIESVLVDRGEFVRQGQPVAVLRHDVESAALVVAQSRAQTDAEVQAAVANLEFARQRRVRAEESFTKKFISAQAYDQAVAEAQVAEQKLAQARDQRQVWEKELALAQAKLDERTIRSPIDGVVAERYFSAGERIEEKPLVRIAQTNPLRVEVVVPSVMFGDISSGMTARVTPEQPGARTLHASVSLVDKILDAPSNTFRVRLRLPNPGSSIPAGLRCKVEFDPRHHSGKATTKSSKHTTRPDTMASTKAGAR